MEAATPGQHRCHSQAMQYRAKDRDGIGYWFFVGSDGQIWKWNNGQETLANSDEARDWVAANMVAGDERDWLLVKLSGLRRGEWESRVTRKYET